jgi:HD superfamily phosphodiesterase
MLEDVSLLSAAALLHDNGRSAIAVTPLRDGR